jgi:hypothetical protein
MEDLKKKKTEAADNLADSVALGANQEMLGRYSEAGKQFKVAYDGIDNETGKELHQGLKKIGNYKATSVSKDGKITDCTKTQQGYAAEVLDTAKQNAENIKQGKAERVARTDDVKDPATDKKRVNDPRHDQVTLDADGNVIPGTEVQMKFYEPDSFVKNVKGKLYADKYPDGKLSVPSDQYDEIKRKLKDEIDKLEKQENLTPEKRKKLEYIKKVEKNLKKSKVSKAEALEARKNPKKVTAREIGKTSHEAGVEEAKVGAAVGGGISIIKNAIAVLTGKKKAEEAAKDVAVDTVTAGGTSYATGVANTALASVMKNSAEKLIRELGKCNAPSYIITTAVSTAKSLKRLCDGEINTNEFFLEIGKSGNVMLASVVVGQLLVPIPIVGALVGGLVSGLLCGTIYDYTVGMKALHAEIDGFCKQLDREIEQLKEYQAFLMGLDIDTFKRETGKYVNAAESLSGGLSAVDFNRMLKVTYSYVGIPCPWGEGTFDDFMNDKSRWLKFG